jgi:hypothetical protein
MTGKTEIKKYERKITPLERFFTHSPYSIVTIIARIKGNISEEKLTEAVSKVQQRHPNLRVRINYDDDREPWFTSEGVKTIPIETIPRESQDHWIQVYHNACQIPFEFDERPAVRFILLHSPIISELMILCHHIICDGLSLAYLARDLMVHMGDPAREVEILPDPVPIERNNMPKEVKSNAIFRFLINRINKQWQKEKIFFDQEDYRNLNEAYWRNAQHKILSIELSETQTSEIVDRCRREKVTVNSALSTAFVGAQSIVQCDKPHHSSIGVAGSLRDRLQKPAGEVMGFYAGVVTLEYIYDGKLGFWENARRFNRKVQPLYTNKHLFKDALSWSYLEPGILESMNFKKLGGFIPAHSTRYQKISAFSKRDDVVLSLLKRRNMDSMNKIVMGTAVTNLTRMNFPREYGTLNLDRLIMIPGGAFPLSNVNLVLGAVTCSGKLSLVVEYVEENIYESAITKIKEKAIEFLLTD